MHTVVRGLIFKAPSRSISNSTEVTAPSTRNLNEKLNLYSINYLVINYADVKFILNLLAINMCSLLKKISGYHNSEIRTINSNIISQRY